MSPFMDIPGCDHARYAQLDYCHAFHLGTGLDMASSCVVLLCKLGHFGNHRSLNNRLWEAFGTYRKWCRENHRVTNITSFSTLGFDMASTLLRLSTFVCPNTFPKKVGKLPLSKKSGTIFALHVVKLSGTMTFQPVWEGRHTTPQLSWPGWKIQWLWHQLLCYNVRCFDM